MLISGIATALSIGVELLTLSIPSPSFRFPLYISIQWVTIHLWGIRIDKWNHRNHLKEEALIPSGG
jgi:hypothetical protein